MKKIRWITIFVLVYSLLHANPIFALDSISIIMDEQTLELESQPQIISGRTMAPLRGIFEAMGATVVWNGETKTITAIRGDAVVKLTIGSNTAFVNTKEISLDVPAQIIESRTFVPLRFISESMGAEVEWIDASRTVVITTDRSHWSDPGDNLTLDMLLNNTWSETETGDDFTFDPEHFINIADTWPDGSDDIFYSFLENENLIGMFWGHGAHLKDHYYKFDPDTQILTEYVRDITLARYSLKGAKSIPAPENVSAGNTGTYAANVINKGDKEWLSSDFESKGNLKDFFGTGDAYEILYRDSFQIIDTLVFASMNSGGDGFKTYPAPQNAWDCITSINIYSRLEPGEIIEEDEDEQMITVSADTVKELMNSFFNIPADNLPPIPADSDVKYNKESDTYTMRWHYSGGAYGIEIMSYLVEGDKCTIAVSIFADGGDDYQSDNYVLVLEKNPNSRTGYSVTQFQNP